MRVIQLAKDLGVEPTALVQLLREIGIPIAGASASVTEAQVSLVVARMERERRAGHKESSEAIQAAIEDASKGPRRRRRRRLSPEPESVPESEAEVEVEPEAEEPQEEEAPDPVQAEAEKYEGAEPAPEWEESPDPVVAASEAEAPDTLEAVDQAVVGGDAVEHVGSDTRVGPLRARLEEGQATEVPEAAWTGARPGANRRLKTVPTPAASAGPGGQVRIQAEGYTTDGQRKRDKKKGKRRPRVDQGAVQENIQRVMAEIKGGGGKKRRRRGSRPTQEEQEQAELVAQEEAEREARTIRVNEFLTVGELSELMDVSAAEIIGSAFKNLGLPVTINQRLDFDQIEMLLEEFGFDAVRETAFAVAEPEEEEPDDPGSLEQRPPVVTVMGHVDHGKTLLLDRIRDSNVIAGESGGITQHIGAYHVELGGNRSITFLDTPGHAAFTAMRARGADVTDIVILIVAADDSVMPQTIEAISHAKNAGVPLVVAVNKIDLPAANPMKVKQELLQHEVQVEEFGGEVLSSDISAKTGDGIEDLLEKVLLQAELLEIRANPNRPALGNVIEAQLDVGKGPVITVLVQKGTLRVGDDFLCGLYDGRVRAMLDERGESVSETGPGTPVQVLGCDGIPQAGDTFAVMGAVEAGEIAGERQRLEREKQLRVKERGLKLGDFSQLVAEGEAIGMLPLIIKGDVVGSVQAVSDALEHLSTDEVRVDIIHRGVGAVNESDIVLAGTAGAIVIGFRARPDTKTRQLAERDDVEIHTYDVIYDAVDDIRSALEGMLRPDEKETLLGAAEVREPFRIRGIGTIAGSYVTEGVIDRGHRVRLVRDGVVVYDGQFSSLKRFKDDVREVREGFECGIGIANFNDVKVGDLIECYRVEQITRTLAGAAEERG